MSPSRLAARSLLFVPGDSPRKIRKAWESGADLLIFDLEDAVAPAAKSDARLEVAAALAQPERRLPSWVRINPLSTPEALHDLAAIVPARPDGIMLPKAGPEDALRLHHYLTALEAASGQQGGTIRIMVVATETPAALFRLGDYTNLPRLAALTWGAEDIATAIGAIDNRDPAGGYDFIYRMARGLCLAGAAAAGVTAIETMHGDFRDTEGLEETAAAARSAGFGGMIAIHPDQVPIINRCFTPSAAEVERATRIVTLFDGNPGAGTLALEGQMLDRPHLMRARAVLERARA